MNWSPSINANAYTDKPEELRYIAEQMKLVRCTDDLRIIAESDEGRAVGFNYTDVLDEAERRAAGLPLGRPLIDWVLFARPLGGFLTAVLQNKLVESFGRADQGNVAAMAQYANWIYNDCPGSAWREQEMSEWRGYCRWWSEWTLREIEKDNTAD